MRLILVFCFLFLANCANQTTALVSVNSSNQNVSTNQVSNKTDEVAESLRINKENVEKLEIQNEKFKTVPEEFKNVDFKNFSYQVDNRIIQLKNGKYEHIEKNNLGGETFSLDDIYFIDLTNDDKKEAILLFYAVGCGGSCDGGRAIIYFYSAQKTKPNLIGKIQTGATAGGCALKSLTIKDRKIIIEQFSKCKKDSELQDKPDSTLCKFCVKGLTNSVYKIFNSRLIKESSTATETSEQNIMNNIVEISINE